MSDPAQKSFGPPGAQPLWGAPMPAGAGPGPGGQPLAPLPRRLLQLAGCLSILLILVVGNALLHDGENPLSPIAAAAERTQQMPGARVSVRAIYSSSALPRPMVATGGGAFNSATDRSRVSLTLSTPTTGTIHEEAISDGTSIYLRGNSVADQLPAGKDWMRIDPYLGHTGEEAMVGGGGSDTDNSLGMLDSADAASMVGHQKVGGRMTRHYRSEIDLGNYADLLRGEGKDDLAAEYEKIGGLITTPVIGEAWVDRKGLLRRMRVVISIPTGADRPSLTMDIRMSLSDFGASPRIDRPDPERVYDATPQFRQRLESIQSS